jgi:hypothetical protein
MEWNEQWRGTEERKYMILGYGYGWVCGVGLDGYVKLANMVVSICCLGFRDRRPDMNNSALSQSRARRKLKNCDALLTLYITLLDTPSNRTPCLLCPLCSDHVLQIDRYEVAQGE